MIDYYPIAVRLKNKKAVVVGGGIIAQRKVLGLLEAGARITVVSPALTPRLKALAKKKKIAWVEDTISRGDIGSADIIIAATSDRKTNKKVSVWSRKAGVLINVVDDKTLSDFISPAITKIGGAIIAVYTDGKAPGLSRDLKNFIKEHRDDFISFRNRP
jgi:siroheme synthase-like protein